MVFILAASSLHHVLETLSPEQKDRFKDKTHTIPGLSLNPNTKNPKKVVQNLLSKDLKDKKDIVIWHDVLNNSISKHDSNNFRALSVFDLILKQFKALHQSPELELKNLAFVLRKENHLSTITDKSRPKRPSKRARNAAKRAAASF